MICKFEKLYNNNSNKPYNIFVASLFFIKNETGKSFTKYKKFDDYLKIIC